MITVPAKGTTEGSDAWRFCVGSGRMSLALRQDYLDSLSLVQSEIGFGHIRGHGLLSDDMGIYTEYQWDGRGHVQYAFGYLDMVVDAYLARGIRPFLELGFMPSALASGTQTVFWWRGNVTPPKDDGRWVDLIRTLLTHLVERYGVDEVRSWPIEMWNEPNLAAFWQGADQAGYFHLYELSARAVKEVDAQLQIGGPAICGGGESWVTDFLQYCQRQHVPVDFVSRHAYSAREATLIPFGSYQELADPTSLLADFASARTDCQANGRSDLPVHITEFNTSYRPDNPVHDTCYNAAYLGRILSEGGAYADSFSYWTFCDMFEEAGVPKALFHGGFGLLTHHQIKKPTFHLFAFFARLGDEILYRDERCHVRRQSDGGIGVVAWNPAAADTGTSRLPIDLGLPVEHAGVVFWQRSSVDEQHGNPRAAWVAMGRPREPSPSQLALLRELAEPRRSFGTLPVEHGMVHLRLELSRNEITLIELSPVRDASGSYPGNDDTRIPGYQRAPLQAPTARD